MKKPYPLLESRVDAIDMHLGQKLRNFRKHVGWTLADLSLRAGVSHQQIHKYVQGHSKMSAATLYRFGAIFSISPSTFFEGYNPKKDLQSFIDSDDILSLEAREKINLLFVEDRASDEFLIRKVLETIPYKIEIYCLHSAEAALDYLKGRMRPVPFIKPDIVLIDINLAKLDDISILRSIKQDRDLQYLPVLLLTNSLSKKNMINAYRNFAGGYITKSLDYTVLKRNLQIAFTYWVDAVVLPEA